MTTAGAIHLQPLTWVQQELYNWLVGYIRKHGYSPTLRQMMEAMGLQSPAPIQGRLWRLQEKGWLTWPKNQTRSITLLGGAETYDAPPPPPKRDIGQLWSDEALGMAEVLAPLGPWGWVAQEFNEWARSVEEPERTAEAIYLKLGQPQANTAGNFLSTKDFAALLDRKPRAIRHWVDKGYLEDDHIFTTGRDSSRSPWFISRVEAMLHLATYHQRLIAHLSDDQIRAAIPSPRAADLAITRLHQWRQQQQEAADG